MNAFKQMLGELVTSKKFMAMLVGLVVAAGAKYGLNLDPEMINVMLGIIGVYILGQGIADHKKEAAKIEAVSAASNNTDRSTPDADKAVKAMSASMAAKE